MSAAAPILDVRGLTVDFAAADGGTIRALHGIDLTLTPGETFALVGESGSGKSVTNLAIMGLLARNARVGGEVRLEGVGDLLALSSRAMGAVRGGQIAMIFQEPMTCLNPVQTVGAQIGEAVRRHRGGSRAQVQAAVIEALAEVEIPDPERRARAYPHELSGGMRQRVVIAMALACQPRILIADEPTTALDVTVQAQILRLLARLRRERGMAVLFITHSLAVVAEIADRVAVMYGGRIVEQARTAELFGHTRHPYTRGLLESLPVPAARGERRLRTMPGQVIDITRPPPGCAFGPRCALRIEPCDEAPIPFFPVTPDRASRCLRWAEL
ncbi:ABC transporter ATP-binding protein [Sphingomonas jatrophae]|uniref:Peptide/nickel transport system ATP-binding protein n=1 Tax=Sphingomonas jatrophae TaxID=1166337 RepID=A0A1I6KAK7_9SPHN|nr:ABC transporter ATP-binding protein [Sphingomonas jatrophae]SFR88236.1 peptide/nickel transport system ATP-binding protein [Sphingomonas jatrophae]